MDIGVDLGTTFSVIAVNGRVDLDDGYPEGMYLENCDVTIVPTPEGAPTFPSVVWEDRETPGVFLVGYEALMKADIGDAPVLFSKRKMGTAEAIPMHDHTLLAKEAAVELLGYLKTCAERALKQPVERAVVSHPAYFDRSQVEETREAAIQAGFDMSAPDQMVMEPVAAALAYTRTDTRDPLRILTYDLGGGTFDVTYLERRGGIIFMRAFDGDHLLGGYNFDRELVHWLRTRLKAKGREIVFDEGQAEDRGRLARLLRLAEATKIKVAEEPSDDARVEIRAQDILVDVTGRRVPVLENITRSEFVQLIRPWLDTTTECCRRTLQKAKVTADLLDKIILVGGSTYAPWVREAISKEFPGRKCELFHPDLCVGAGAAIHAKMVLPRAVRGEQCRLILDVPSESVLERTDITGRVTGANPPDAHTATLKLPAGRRLGPTPLQPNGAFRFSEVELLLGDEPSKFVLTVEDNSGKTILRHEFEIFYAPKTADTTTVTTVLPKPLFLETLEGLVPLAQDGVCLPAECNEVLTRDNDNPNITIRIFQVDDPIGAIRIEDIPREGGRGSQVALECVVTEKNQIQGKARIIGPTGRLVKESAVRVTFDIPEAPAPAGLVRQFEALRARCGKILADSKDEAQKMVIVTKALRLTKKVEHLLEQQPLERQEVQAGLKELARIVTPPTDIMEPTKKQFMDELSVCREAVAEESAKAQAVLASQEAPSAGKGTGRNDKRSTSANVQLGEAVLAKAREGLQKAEQYRKVLGRVENEGLAAHERKDKKAWATVNDTLSGVRARLQERPDIEPPAIILKLVAAMSVDRELSQLIAKRRMLEEERRLKDWNAEIDRLAAAIQKVRREVMAVDDGLPRDRVRAQLAVLLTQKLEPARQDITKLGVDTHKR